ncbi:hypothetical protein ACP70R_017967 [Stipagrostis hirtigluma subsp. patula]
MGGRFVLQKLSSGLSRSRSLFGAHVASSSPITLPAASESIGALGNSFHGASAHPSTVVSTNRGIHGCEGSVRARGDPLYGASAHTGSVVPSNREIDGYAARYFNTFPCSANRTFSSSSPAKKIVDWEAERAALIARLDARREYYSSEAQAEAQKASVLAVFDSGKAKVEATSKVLDANFAEFKAKLQKESADFMNIARLLMFVFGLVCFFMMAEIIDELKRKGRSTPKVDASTNGVVENPNAPRNLVACSCSKS